MPRWWLLTKILKSIIPELKFCLKIVLLGSYKGVSHPRMRKWGLLLERAGTKHGAPRNSVRKEEGLLVGLIREMLLVWDKNYVMWKKKRNFNHTVFSLKKQTKQAITELWSWPLRGFQCLRWSSVWNPWSWKNIQQLLPQKPICEWQQPTENGNVFFYKRCKWFPQEHEFFYPLP